MKLTQTARYRFFLPSELLCEVSLLGFHISEVDDVDDDVSVLSSVEARLFDLYGLCAWLDCWVTIELERLCEEVVARLVSLVYCIDGLVCTLEFVFIRIVEVEAGGLRLG